MTTPRLALREWDEADLAAFQAICSDPVVMATLGDPLSLEETAATIARMQATQAEHGHCFWALERLEDRRLIGWCGVIRGRTGPVAGKVEIGWRLAADCWGQGYASEAARAARDWAFAHLPDDALYAITSRGNRRSRAVMERLGMTYCPELDFAHPGVPHYSPLCPHVTYRLLRGDAPGDAPQG
ncbi:GNAT family N-acetyltransferase [Novosphingobium profundi]|nr:GNAT family N-acetyltransferase [Novosphingobium profundi]